MKKLFILTLVLLMAIMGTVSASKSKFKDPRYDFKSLRTFIWQNPFITPKISSGKTSSMMTIP